MAQEVSAPMLTQINAAPDVLPLRRRPSATDIRLRKERVLQDAEAMLAISAFTHEHATAMSTDSPHREELLEYAERLERLGHIGELVELVEEGVR
jgi:hypothetical protein